VDDWYTIGLVLGVALGLGVALAGLLAVGRAGLALAIVFAAGAGAALGYVVGEEPHIVAAIIGGAVGAVASAVLVQGALRRGGTRTGVGAYVGAAGVVVALLGLVPILGYVELLAVPLLAARMRAREAERFAGLRTLAK
jgi:hypothetical protein